MLADYASGAATPGVALLVATQLTYCPESRARVAAFERIGGRLLAEETPEPMRAASRQAALAAVAGTRPALRPEPRSEHGEAPASTLPAPLVEALHGCAADRLAWRRRLPGVAEYALGGFGDERVSLLRARPGARVPRHTHDGTEATLVLSGTLVDGGRRLCAGDVSICTDDDDHCPEIAGTEVCLCLVVLDGGLRFTGPLGPALNILAR